MAVASALAVVALLAGGCGGNTADVTAPAPPTPTSTPAVDVLDEQVRAWCLPSDDPIPSAQVPAGPRDVMVPTPVRGMVFCGTGDEPVPPGATTKPSVAYVVTDLAEVTPIVDALNALKPTNDLACTLIFGGTASAVFITTPSSPVRVDIDRANCSNASNGTRSAPYGGAVTEMMDALSQSPTARPVDLGEAQ